MRQAQQNGQHRDYLLDAGKGMLKSKHRKIVKALFVSNLKAGVASELQETRNLSQDLIVNSQNSQDLLT